MTVKRAWHCFSLRVVINGVESELFRIAVELTNVFYACVDFCICFILTNMDHLKNNLRTCCFSHILHGDKPVELPVWWKYRFCLVFFEILMCLFTGASRCNNRFGSWGLGGWARNVLFNLYIFWLTDHPCRAALTLHRHSVTRHTT